MEQPKKTLQRHTRGEWKGGELKAAVLGVLIMHQLKVETGIEIVPCLTATRIALETEGNYYSIKTLLKKWVRGGHIRRFHAKPYGYSITRRGNRCFFILTDGYISKRHRRPVIVDKKALIRRCPGLQGKLKRRLV